MKTVLAQEQREISYKWVCPHCDSEEIDYDARDNPSILMCDVCYKETEVYFGDL